jgi:hypothetical protein
VTTRSILNDRRVRVSDNDDITDAPGAYQATQRALLETLRAKAAKARAELETLGIPTGVWDDYRADGERTATARKQPNPLMAALSATDRCSATVSAETSEVMSSNIAASRHMKTGSLVCAVGVRALNDSAVIEGLRRRETKKLDKATEVAASAADRRQASFDRAVRASTLTSQSVVARPHLTLT